MSKVKAPKNKKSATGGTKAAVTSKQRADEAWLNPEEKLRLIFDSITEGITITDLKGNITDVNEAAVRMGGFSDREEQIGRNGADFVAPKDRARAVEEIVKVFKEGSGSGTLEYTIVGADGHEVEAEVSITILRDGSGKPIGFINVSRDITDRKQMEEVLIASEEKLHTIFESMNDALTVMDLKGTITDANEAAVQLHGFIFKKELIGRSALDFVAEKDRVKALENTKRMYKEGRGGTIDYTLVTKDGTEIEAEFSAALLHDNIGKPTGFIAVSRDITERKRMEEKLRLTFEAMGDAVTVTDLEGNILEVNELAYSKAGYSSKEEFIGENGFDLVSPEDRDRIAETIVQAIKEGRDSQAMECTFHPIKGDDYEAEFTVSVIRDASRNPTGFITTSRDITERKRAEEVIRASEEKLRGIFDTIPDGVTFTNMTGTILDLNEAMVRMYGHSNKEELIGRNAIDFVAEEYRDMVVQLGLQAIKEGRNIDRVEYRLLNTAGEEFDVELYAAPLRDSSGEPIAWVNVSRDITERKKAEEAIRESEETLRLMFESTSDGIVITNPALTIIETNAAAPRLLGYGGKEELIGQSAIPFMSTDTEADSESHTEFSVSQLRDSAGNTAGFIGICRDITERKRAEKKLKETLEDLARSNQELEQFAYVASHDLQEPLRMVSSYTNLLARRYKGKLDADGDEFIEFAVDGSNRMMAMIQALLTYSRVGTRGKEFEPTDCEDILSKALSNLQVAIEEKGAAVTHGPLPTVTADDIQLLQLFQNLLGNAIKFCDEKQPQVHVSAEEQDEDWLFSFRDNGIGIDPEFKDRIFLIFQRLHGKGEYKGTGIGLAVCKKIVERHDGRIWVESEPGKGATFYFTAPKERKEEDNE